MEHPVAVVTENDSDTRFATQHPDRSSTARCEGMRVSYNARMPAMRQESACDDIEIIIPGDRAALRPISRGADQPPHGADPQLDAIVISLDPVFLERTALEALGSGVPSVAKRHVALDPFMKEIGNMLRSEFQSSRIPRSAYLESLAAVIAIHVARNYCGAPRALPRCAGLAPHKLARAQTFIRDHLAASVRVEQIAAAVHMSTFHFARMFKEATGQPPHVYVTVQRVECAKELLRSSSLSLTDVAASVGFQTQSHFTGVFHRYAGVTPRVFRLNSRVARAFHGSEPSRAYA